MKRIDCYQLVFLSHKNLHFLYLAQFPHTSLPFSSTPSKKQEKISLISKSSHKKKIYVVVFSMFLTKVFFKHQILHTLNDTHPLKKIFKR